MAQATFNLTDKALTSTYTGIIVVGVPSTTTPTTDTSGAQSITVPAYSAINWVKVYATLGSPLHGTAIRQVQVDTEAAHLGYFSNASALTKTLFTPGSHSIRFLFKSAKNNTSYSSGGTVNSSTLDITGISIVIDYTAPDEGETVETVVKSGLSLNKTSCKCGDDVRFNILNQSPGVYHVARVGISGVYYVDSNVPKGATYHDFEIPIGWQRYISTTTREAYCRLFTYRDAARTDYVGYSDKALNLTLSDDNYPVISDFTITRIPGFTDETITGYVQGFSQAQLSGMAEAQYFATISQYKFILGAWSDTGDDVSSNVLTDSGTVTFTLEVTDSRGRKKTATSSIAVEPYAAPVLVEPVAFRSDVAGAPLHNGTYASLMSGFSISSLDSENAATLWGRVYQKGEAASEYVEMAADTAEIISGLNPIYSYTADILVTDKLGEHLYTMTIPSAKAVLHALPGVTGMAVGKYAETVDVLDIAFAKALLNGKPVPSYEVGDLYITISNTDPNTKYGGTWILFAEGKTLFGYKSGDADFGTMGNAACDTGIGGAKAHTHGLSEAYAKISNGLKMAAKSVSSYVTNYTGAAASSASSTATAGVELGGTTDSGSSLPPYVTVKMWVRTA